MYAIELLTPRGKPYKKREFYWEIYIHRTDAEKEIEGNPGYFKNTYRIVEMIEKEEPIK